MIRALCELQIPYAVWTDERKTLPNGEFVHLAPVSAGAKSARREAEGLLARGGFTHGIDARKIRWGMTHAEFYLAATRADLLAALAFVEHELRIDLEAM